MMRKIIIAIGMLLCIVTAVFGMVFIKSQVVTNENLLAICLNNNQLKIETAESAKYISDVENKISRDTIELIISTTSIYNPFSKREIQKTIILKPNLQYVKIGNSIIPLIKVNACHI
ncbi:MAG TPA: hypothetical protein VGN20_28455 [Mucilaginibacter sp.]|jgi:hypothetical protein